MAGTNDLITELTNAYWAELETVMNYLSSSVNLDGVRAEEIKKSLAADVTEELGHAQMLAKRIKELGGTIPGSMDFKREQRSLQPGKDTTDVVNVIKGVLEAEESAIAQYRKIIKMCEGEDYVTQDLCIDILSNEETHRSLFHGFSLEYSKK
ncbi:MAG TPA: ferritin-like domain-containing protein [Ignavibacteriales bacterium]|nr:ferritin-like domain-containing protein [Ignavibacteriales bacterium]